MSFRKILKLSVRLWVHSMKNFLSSIEKSITKKAYSLKSIVMTDQKGLIDAVLDEIHVSLNSHKFFIDLN